MMQSVSAAEADAESAYVGAIRALALAIDARDSYTAGHSERVSPWRSPSAAQMRMSADELEILRLGRAAARHRQDRDQRRRAAETRAVDAGRVRAGAGTPERRRAHPPQRPVPRRAAAHRRVPPRAARTASAIRIDCRASEIPLLARIVHVVGRLRRNDERARLSSGARRVGSIARALAPRRHAVRHRVVEALAMATPVDQDPRW